MKLIKKILVIYITLILFSILYLALTDPKDWNGPNSSRDIPKKYSLDRFLNMLYFSSTTHSTIGYGDIYPVSKKSKAIVLIQHFVVLLEIIKLFL